MSVCTHENTRVEPLLPLVGRDLQAPLADGTTARYVQLDLAASAPALQRVADELALNLPAYASVHRGAGYASQISTDLYEQARETVARFVGARPDDQTVFTRNTTDALNLLASVVPPGGEVVTFDHEHHANLLPWRRCLHRVLPTGRTVAETLEILDRALAQRPAALVAVTGASNVTGEVLPLARFVEVAHRHGARIAVDGAQLVPHRRVDVAALGIDYLAFSGHKLYAPFGAGVLVGRTDWLDAAEPYLAGGGATVRVTAEGVCWAGGAQRHEAGSPNVLGAAALATACRTLLGVSEQTLVDHERVLTEQLLTGLSALPGVTVLQVWSDSPERVGVVSFTVEGHDAHEVATFLSSRYGVGVRNGKFCAHRLLDRLGCEAGAVRASVGVGTGTADVERLLAGVTALTLG